MNQSNYSLSGFFKRQITGTGNPDDKSPKSELFESKFVKQIIENYNNVIELIEQQEKELGDYIGAEDDSDDDRIGGSPS